MKITTYYRWVFSVLALAAMPALAHAQTWQWASAPTSITGPGGVPDSGGSAIAATALDAAGNTVVAGHFSGTITLGSTTLTSAGYTDIFVARLSPTGQWTQAVSAGGPGQDSANALVLTSSGDVVVAGTFGNLAPAGAVTTFQSLSLPNEATDAFIALLSPAGQWTMAQRVGGPGRDMASALVLDRSGNAVVTGSFQNTINFGTSAFTLTADGMTTATFVARLNLAANTWTQTASSGYQSANLPFLTEPSALAIDAVGNVVVAGQFGGAVSFGSTALSARDRALFVARLSTAGQWTQAVALSATTTNGNGAGAPQARALALDAAGDVTLVGLMAEPVDVGGALLTSAGAYDVLVVRLNAAGQWTQALRAGGPAGDIATAVAVTATGAVVVAGIHGGLFPTSATTTFGNFQIPSVGGPYDAFVAQLSPGGQWESAVSIGGPGWDHISSVAVDAAGAITVGGYHGGPLAIGSTALPNAAGYNIAFAARLASTGLATHPVASAGSFALAPNPATGAVRLTWPAASANAQPVQVLDALGREVRRLSLPAGITQTTLDATGLTPGLYLVRCGVATSRLRVE